MASRITSNPFAFENGVICHLVWKRFFTEQATAGREAKANDNFSELSYFLFLKITLLSCAVKTASTEA